MYFVTEDPKSSIRKQIVSGKTLKTEHTRYDKQKLIKGIISSMSFVMKLLC